MVAETNRPGVTVRFPDGLHARTVARIVRLFKRFRCRVLLRTGNRVANTSSLLSILLLTATCDTQLEVQASGEDEDAAVRAAEAFFQNDDENASRPLQSETVPAQRPRRAA